MKKLIKRFCFLNDNASLRDITNKVCEIVEEDDRYIYYVNGINLINKFRNEYCYRFYLYGIDDVDLKDKPIYYVFSDIIFNRELFILSFFDVRIVFKNCTFSRGIRLLDVNDVVFENNKYCYYHGVNNFFCGYGKKLKFINDNIYNNKFYFNKMGINIKFEKVEIVNTNICIDEVSFFINKDRETLKLVNSGEICINANEIVINNSVIKGATIFLSCDILKGNNKNLIEAIKGIMIDAKNNYFDLSDIVSSNIVMNQDIYNSEEDIDLVNSRKCLINQLKAISNYFNDINMIELKEAEYKIKGRNISKILKK